MSGLLGNGIAFPLGVDQRGALALARGDEDVAQAIGIILATAPGERPMRPEFGCRVHDHVFDQLDPETLGRVEGAVREALDRWEPRIDVEAVDFDLARADEGELHVELTYRLRETGSIRNLVHPFYLIPAEDPA
ncbi:baseplate protein [Conexibacter sp. W3-3-2]|uniref:Baseplate protein n=1 Tax=Paraconexibacter algicola TaxID=2133960 RepID=A0A2T4UGD6_9ACTN|nr:MULTISPECIES: GPW/gp25 family protein [Solirubrobacterales]MTD44540.1 baseplate protein [Conexibacter sp. W3-3-2]PTL58288.1 baseplate protein [Paraconexibacter algicola]